MATLSYAFSIPLDSQNSTLVVPAFDSALGDLNHVYFLGSASAVYRSMVAVLGEDPQTVGFGGDASTLQLDLQTPTSFAFPSPLTVLSAPFAPPAYELTYPAGNSSNLFKGSGGSIVLGEDLLDLNVQSIVGISPLIFVGEVPGVPSTVELAVVRIILLEIDSPSETDVIASYSGMVGCPEVTMIYDYTPAP